MTNDATMTYEEFAEKFRSVFVQMMNYRPSEVGSLVFAEKLADLADAYPE